jgi:translation initiation factor 2 gamma subunit (eIF-2gamma)
MSKKNLFLINTVSTSTGGHLNVKDDLAEIWLTLPVCTEVGMTDGETLATHGCVSPPLLLVGIFLFHI